MAAKALNLKQQRFVAEYLIDLNATRAATRAGYSAKTAEQIGYQLLQKTSVAEAIATGQARLAAEAGVTASKIVAELAKLGFSNMGDYVNVNAAGEPAVDLSALDRDKWAAVGEVTIDTYMSGSGEEARDVKRVKFKLADKRASLVDLGRHLGMFTDKLEVNGKLAVDALEAARARVKHARS